MLMKTRNIIAGVAFLMVTGSLLLTNCKKDSSTTSSNSSLTSQQTTQVQNSDAQDAIADKTEEDVDNNLDELQNNNYTVSTAKSAFGGLNDTVVITVDHPDTTTFPKVVTIWYYSYQDSSNNEPITKDGEIIVTIDRANASHPLLISRAIVFNDFKITTDSTTLILNGTRTVNRVKAVLKLTNLAVAKTSVTDDITSAMKFAVVTTGNTDTLTFTRNVNRTRIAIAYYKNVNYVAGQTTLYNLKHLRFKHLPSLDALKYTGTVTGFNERDSAYTKTITDTLVIKVFKGSPVITIGTMTYSVGTALYDISFKEDPSHPHFTLVTVTNEQTGKTKSFDRRFGRKFNKWW